MSAVENLKSSLLQLFCDGNFSLVFSYHEYDKTHLLCAPSAHQIFIHTRKLISIAFEIFDDKERERVNIWICVANKLMHWTKSNEKTDANYLHSSQSDTLKVPQVCWQLWKYLFPYHSHLSCLLIERCCKICFTIAILLSLFGVTDKFIASISFHCGKTVSMPLFLFLVWTNLMLENAQLPKGIQWKFKFKLLPSKQRCWIVYPVSSFWLGRIAAITA